VYVAVLERWYNSNRYFYFLAIFLRSHEALFALRPLVNIPLCDTNP
jgi:hypothetical protein